MKLFAVLISIFALTAEAKVSAPPAALFKVSCAVEMVGNSAHLNRFVESVQFENKIAQFGDSYVSLALGPYTLSAGIDMNRPFGSVSMEPTLSMTLYRADPIAGQVGFTRLQGMELNARPVAQPLTMFGLNFLNFNFEGTDISRVDYNCAVTRTR